MLPVSWPPCPASITTRESLRPRLRIRDRGPALGGFAGVMTFVSASGGFVSGGFGAGLVVALAGAGTGGGSGGGAGAGPHTRCARTAAGSLAPTTTAQPAPTFFQQPL